MRLAWGAGALLLSVCVSEGQAGQRHLASGLAREPQNWGDETISFAVSAGWLTGQSHEYVYYDGDKISELIWDMEHAFVFNGDFGFRLTPALKLNMHASLGGNIDGYMEDYDWLALDRGVTDWTDLSQHDDTKLEHFARFDMNLQYDVLQSSTLAVGALVGVRFTGVKWNAYGGSFTYTSDPETAFRDEEGSFADGALVITYEQAYATPYLGAAATLAADRFQFVGSVVASPLSFLSTDDDHWLRDLTLSANFDATKFWGVAAEVSYRWNEYSQFFAHAAAERYREATGDSTYDYSSGAFTFVLEGGARADHENLQIAVGFRVFN